ncbi:MAG: type II secretion system protein GspD [Planctomycetota bacterium]
MYRDRNPKSETKIGTKLYLWSFALILMAATAVAGVEASTGEQVQIIDEFVVKPEKDSGGAEKDFGVREALAMLGSMCQKNIVPTPGVDGVLAFRRLRNVTFDEAMDAILGEDFKYEQEGKLIKVYTKDEYKKIKEDPERKIYRVFTLYYITAQEAQNLMTPVLGTDALVQVSSPAEKQISGGVGSNSGAGGGSASTGGGAAIGSGGGGNSLALHDTIVVYDFPENIEKAVELLKTLDVRPKQVLVEATILSALLTEGMELGVDWNLMAGTALDGTGGTQDYVSGGTIDRGAEATSPIADISNITAGTPMETFGFATQGGRGLRIGVSAGDVRMFITALESVTDTTILANPKILTVNKQEGAVLIGTNLGYRSSTTIGVGGVASEGEVKFLQTGTQLVFRPYIGDDGYIRMEVYPKDSSATLNEDGVPNENTTQLRTNIIVKDGETIVIGGLFRDVLTTTRNQVPLLGDIPVVGSLFRGTTDSTTREEVIVLLTTHIIDEPSEVDGVARADDVRRKRFGAKDELQEIGRAKLAEDAYAKAVKCYIEGDNESAMKQLKIALTLRPTYLEAMRLKERIIAETSPAEADKLERIILEAIDKEEASKWQRK